MGLQPFYLSFEQDDGSCGGSTLCGSWCGVFSESLSQCGFSRGTEPIGYIEMYTYTETNPEG